MKKSMRTLAVLGTCAVLALGICGCDEKDTETTTAATTAADILTPDDTEATFSLTEDDTTEAATTEASTASSNFCLGSVENDLYRNDFFGIEIEIPEGWTVGDTKLLASQSGITEDQYNEQAILSNIEATKGRTYADFYVSDASTGDSINIQVSKPFAGNQMSKEEMLDSIIDVTKTQLESSGIEVSSLERSSATIAGREEPIFEAVLQNGGLTGYEKQFYYTNGDFVAYVTVATINGDRTNELLKYVKR